MLAQLSDEIEGSGETIACVRRYLPPLPKKKNTLTAKGSRQRFWGSGVYWSTGLEPPNSDMEPHFPGVLESGGRESGGPLWGSTVIEPPISDLEPHLLGCLGCGGLESGGIESGSVQGSGHRLSDLEPHLPGGLESWGLEYGGLLWGLESGGLQGSSGHIYLEPHLLVLKKHYIGPLTSFLVVWGTKSILPSLK